MSKAGDLFQTGQEAAQEPRQFDALFEALFDEHWQRVCGLLYRLVDDPDEAEDLALETFVRLHRRPPPDRQQMAGWLYRVATNLGYNALRARQRRRRYETQAGTAEPGAHLDGDPELIVARAQERAQVRRTLSAMQERQAQLLILRHSGFSYAEIAAALEVAPASVGALLARAEREFEKRFRAS